MKNKYKPSVFLQITQAAFIVMKICGIMRQNWFIVFLPFWLYLIAIAIAEYVGGKRGQT